MSNDSNRVIERLLTVLEEKETEGTIVPSTITKQTYLDLIEITFSAYVPLELWTRTKADGTYFDLHAYSRVACCLACLLSAGRLQELRLLWEHMMLECCKEISSMSKNEAADFAIKEIMLAIKVMNPHLTASLKHEWLRYLAKIDPYSHYVYVARTSEDENHMHNINVYNMVGEFLRESEGLTDSRVYFEHHWPIQLKRFNEYGMYCEPGCPTLYDLTTRMHIKLMLHYGYQGVYADQLDEQIQKGAFMTLLTQSVNGELPYGGRSNQFLFNEALIAVNGEFEANRYNAIGMKQFAGMFKRSAHLAIQSIMRWITMVPPRHIKNAYSIDVQFGTEVYAYYDKYLATFGSFLAMGYIVADDGIKETAIPAEQTAYVIVTPEDFHKVIAHAGGYTLELDLKADLHYDATGLGRIHRYGVPSELAISTPFTGNPSYRLPDHILKRYVSVSPGWYDAAGKLHFLSEYSESVTYEVQVLKETLTSVEFTVCYSIAIEGNTMIHLRERYLLGEDGLHYSAERLESNEPIVLQLPLLVTNGESTTNRDVTPNTITVRWNEYCYTVTSDAYAMNWDREWIANRNGEYERVELYSANNRIQAHFALNIV